MSTSYAAAADALLAGLAHADVLAAMSPQLPEALLGSVLRAARRRDVSLTLRIADLSGRWAFVDEQALEDAAAGRLRLIALAGAIPLRLAHAVDHLPVSLWDIDRMIEHGQLPVDIFVERVRATSSRARLSHGEMLGYSTTALRVAARVGFEVGPRASAYEGDDGIPLSRADVLVRGGLLSSRPARLGVSPVHEAIARNLEPLIPNGATLQLGVGRAPALLAERLLGKADLGLHSGILPGQVQRLIADGVVTGRRKSTQTERHVATGLMGGEPRGWGENVLLEPLQRTHDPARLLEHENLWAINSAIEIDLSGQVNAEYLGTARIASGSGQIDFVRAAHASAAGASVIALPARAGTGAPRIVSRLASPATVGGNDVDFVVTEYGIACLQGRSADERRRALANVAHPADRTRLRADPSSYGSD